MSNERKRHGIAVNWTRATFGVFDVSGLPDFFLKRGVGPNPHATMRFTSATDPRRMNEFNGHLSSRTTFRNRLFVRNSRGIFVWPEDFFFVKILGHCSGLSLVRLFRGVP